MTAKTYAPRTRQLAADVVLQAAVDDVLATFALHASLGDCAGCNVGEVAQATLLAAVQSADLLLGTP